MENLNTKKKVKEQGRFYKNKMEKLKILSVRKSEKKQHYVFSKEQKSLSVINQILNEFGLKDYERNCYDFLDVKNKIEEYNDELYELEFGEFLIDMIFGDKKIFLIINTKLDKQIEITKIINKHTIM